MRKLPQDSDAVDVVAICEKICGAGDSISDINGAVRELTDALERCGKRDCDEVVGPMLCQSVFLRVIREFGDVSDGVPVLYCIGKLVSMSDGMCEMFADDEFLRLWGEILGSGVRDCVILVLYILYNVTLECSVEVHERVLECVSMNQMWELVERSGDDEDVLVRIFLCLKNFARHPLKDEDGVLLLRALAAFQEWRSGASVKLSNVVGKYSMWIVYYMLMNEGLNYEVFCSLKLCECVVRQLDMAPVEAQCRACYVIALLCDRFGFRVSQPDSLVRLMFDSGSCEYRLAAGTAMNSLIKVDPAITGVFLDARRLKKMIKRAPSEDIRMKDILISVIRRTVEHAPGETASLLFDFLPQFTELLTQLMESDDEAMLEDILVILANLTWVSTSVSADALQALSASLSPSLFSLRCSDRLDPLRQQICDVFVKI